MCVYIYIYIYILNLSKSTDHGTTFKWSIRRNGRIMELEYHYNGIAWAIISHPNKGVGDLGRWSVREVLLCVYITCYI